MNRFKIKLIILLLIGAASSVTAQSNYSYATFAGGCFWCMEKPFDSLEGVISTTSGFSGGHTLDPSYREVSNGDTGHIEVVHVEFDASRVSYEDLLYAYWRNIDPMDRGGQFCDRGHTYTTAIFYHSENQRRAAEESKRDLRSQLSRRIVTDIREYEEFYPAEDYHQDYYIRNPLRYKFYRGSCGRDNRLDEIWGNEARGGVSHE
jgi:peptide-methionine (S)-S-oxide reductase